MNLELKNVKLEFIVFLLTTKNVFKFPYFKLIFSDNAIDTTMKNNAFTEKV